ncbi:MAG: YDG domain-containing protein [Bacteroidota bacterium]
MKRLTYRLMVSIMLSVTFLVPETFSQIPLNLENVLVEDKIYDGTTPATILSPGTLTGMDEGDDVTFNAELLEAYFDSADAGTSKTVTITNIILTGADAGKYTINDQYTQADITKAILTVTGVNHSKTYNAALYTDFSVTYEGFVNGEDESVLGGELYFLGDALDAVSVGQYYFFPAGLESTNYDFFFMFGTLDILPAELHITAENHSKAYDGNVFTGFTANLTGFVGGEDSTVLEGELSFAGPALTAIYPGSYSVFPEGLFATNYDIYYNMGTLQITKAPLTLTAHDITKIEGLSYTFSGTEYSITGLVEGTDDSVVSVSLSSSGTDASAPAGDYPIIIGNAQGTGLEKYTITYQEGTFTVTERIVLTLEGTVASDKVYDGATTATIADPGTLTGIQEGDLVELDVSTLTATFLNKNIGTDKLVTLHNLNLTGPDAEKYTIGNQYTYADITPRELFLEGFFADDKTYDGTSQATGTGFIDNRIVGDDLTFTYQAAFASPDAGTEVPVVFTDIAISGGIDLLNYSLITLQGNGTAAIFPAPLSLVADDHCKTYGEEDPEFTWQIGLGQLFGSDIISGSLEREPGEDVGEYAILQGSLTAGTNYNATFTEGVFTIQPDSLIVTIEPQEAADAGATWSIDGENWYDSGFALALDPGEYTVQFSTFNQQDWYTPEAIPVVHGTQTIITGVYTGKRYLTMLPPDGNGSVWPTEGNHDFPMGSEISLTATPDQNWTFLHWLIDGIEIAENPYPLTISENTTVQAVFAPVTEIFTLTIAMEGQGEVNVNGLTYAAPVEADEGTVLTLEALPETGWIFSHWLGDLEGTENPAEIALTADKQITAVFVLQTFTVTFNITETGGAPIDDATITLGEVANEPGDYVFTNVLPGIYPFSITRSGYVSISSNIVINQDRVVNIQLMPVTSPTYTVTFEVQDEYENPVDGAEITFAGVSNPAGNYVFPGISSGTHDYMITREGHFPAEGSVYVNSNESVVVTLELTTFTLEISTEGEGTTTPVPGVHLIDKHTTVNLLATPTEGHLFSHWVINGENYADAEMELLMDENKAVTAYFEEEPPVYNLTIAVEGPGTTDPVPGSYEWQEGSEILLTAIEQDENSTFVKWTINGTEHTEPQINVVMTADIHAVAYFEGPQIYTLTVNINGQGTTTPGSGHHFYEEGTEVALEAFADEGFVFTLWTVNGIEYTDPAVTLVMNEDKTATAWFDEEQSDAHPRLNSEKFSVYPIPASHKVTVEYTTLAGKGSVSLSDLQGRIVMNNMELKDPGNGTLILDISSLPAGLYFLVIKNDQGTVSIRLPIVR